MPLSLSTVQLNKEQTVNYTIILHSEKGGAIMHSVGIDLQVNLTGLEAFTTYYIRVQACQAGKVYIFITYLLIETSKSFFFIIFTVLHLH